MTATWTVSGDRKTHHVPTLPFPRGPMTRWLFHRLRGRPTSAVAPVFVGDALVDDDLHLALHCLYDLEFRRFAGVAMKVASDRLVHDLRRQLEDVLLAALQADITGDAGEDWRDLALLAGPGVAVDALLAAFDGPSLSRFMAAHGTHEQFREFLIHRSGYQLKEADPHTMGLVRLVPGPRKSAFVEIQFDEYGGGRPGQSHAELFARAMRAAHLEDGYGHYLNRLPGTTLATGNLLSLFATRRDLIAPLVGHLALFEMSSVGPMGRYANAAHRLGFPAEVAAFYEVHVVADAHHGDLARTVLLGDRPHPDDDLDPRGLVWGAQALLRAEDRFARAVLMAWRAGTSSLADAAWAPRPRR